MNSDGTASWLYVAACLVVPAIWGATCAWLYGKLDARRIARTSEGDKELSPHSLGDGTP